MNFNHHQTAKKIGLAFLATFVSMAAISAPALAGNNKVYPGSNCKPQESGTTGIAYGHNATNTGNTTVTVKCPIVRENTTGPVGGGPNSYIYVNSNTVSCTFRTSNLYGVGTFNSQTPAPTFVTAGVYRINIAAVPQVSQGSYHISCTLPPQTAVLLYSVAE
jgi:hypothetical protein